MTLHLPMWLVVVGIFYGLAGLICGAIAHNLTPKSPRGMLAKMVLTSIAAVTPNDIVKVFKVWTTGVVAVLVFLGMFQYLTACNGDAQTAFNQQIAVYDYETQQQQCVDLAPDKVHADLCRNAVKQRWCGQASPLSDAGACNYDSGVVDSAVSVDVIVTDAGKGDSDAGQ